MTITARVICDSMSPDNVRLTTMVLRYPRFIHSEFMTHRVFSRNAASSRAIPPKKMLEMVLEDPAWPIHWGKNQKGMQAREELSAAKIEECKDLWIDARDNALMSAECLIELGLHKQIVNRILEPFAHIEVVCTATEWTNFFNLRRHEDAQPEIKALAEAMYDARAASIPEGLEYGDWHTPFISDEDRLTVLESIGVNGVDIQHGKIRSYDMRRYNEIIRQCSVARCARVSYLTHEGTRDIQKDLALYEKLLSSRHLSPFEHVAIPMDVNGPITGNFNKLCCVDAATYNTQFVGNFRGWVQLRKTIEGESGES